MKTEKEYEKYLKRIIFPELERGRPGWDKPHTEAVVHWIKNIINNSPELELDMDVLVIAAYAHDWGYADLFDKGAKVDLDDILDAKKEHMIIGAGKLAELLKNKAFNFLTFSQKQRALHLVRNHDNLSYIKDDDERILVEADTLGALDVDFIKPFTDKKQGERYMQGVIKKRLPLFITDYGKKQFKILFKKRENYYKSL
jgi:hypothetical protein